MSKAFMTKRKTATALIAVVMTVMIIFGGTFAWQSISQEALNEVKAAVNPGGRLHDDFNDITDEVEPNPDGTPMTMTFNKDVYVENFTTYATNGVQIFARIRLDEYMEFGVGAGDATAANRDENVESLVYGATLENKNSWTTHIPGNTEDPFHEFWNWKVSNGEDPEQGAVTYMPTYNKNKDSLEADINGTFDAGFTDYVDYTLDENKTAYNWAIYDIDDNDADELNNEYVDIDNVINGTQELSEGYNQHVSIVDEEHTVQKTLTAYVITMDDWLKLPAGQQKGNFWVWDSDGWAYWANPISPETATGVLLDGISRTDTIINEDWYYAINVVAQFITKDNLGKETGNGFYAPNAGKFPSNNALSLLKTIGVEVDTNVESTAEFENALKLGGNIDLGETVVDTAAVISSETLGTNFDTNYAWSTGGTITGGEIITNNSAYAGMFINNENNYPTEGDGASDAVLNEVKVSGESVGYSVYVQAIDAPVMLNEIEVSNDLGGGIYAEWKGHRVTLNGCTVAIPTEDTGVKDWYLSAVAASNGAEMVINGGKYTGKYAAYVYSSGGTITINDGTFYGDLRTDAGEIIIKGGSFSEDPTAYVDLEAGYTVTYNEATGLYDVD